MSSLFLFGQKPKLKTQKLHFCPIPFKSSSATECVEILKLVPPSKCLPIKMFNYSTDVYFCKLLAEHQVLAQGSTQHRPVPAPQ